MAAATAILDTLRAQLDTSEYKKLHWEGAFADYLGIALETPGVTRTAHQRLYDMILSHGSEDVYENKDKLPRYKFFTEFASRHADGIYGLDRSINQLVNTFKSAALGYGTERRVILLHGPVGSAKSTIARLLKRGLEEYSRTDAGRYRRCRDRADCRLGHRRGGWRRGPLGSAGLPTDHLLATHNSRLVRLPVPH